MAAPDDPFVGYDLDAMNETDVRENLVYPLLRMLGYRQGSPANIVTEKKLRYERHFLGRKKDTDPPLVGRADYICDVVGHGRWPVEVKPPSRPIAVDDVQQAYSYAAHPEVGAVLFLVTNGRQFEVYRIGNADSPIYRWELSETMERLVALKNLLGPDAIKRRAEVPIDLGKPIALGFGSKIKIVGGFVVYDEFSSDWALLRQAGVIANQRAAIVGGEISRLPDGRLEGHIEQAGPYDALLALAQIAGVDILKFSCAEEYISSEKAEPTIMQNFVEWKLAAGTQIPQPAARSLGVPSLPFKVDAQALTEAVGYVEGASFTGTFTVKFSLAFSDWRLPGLRGRIPDRVEAESAGTFELSIQDAGGR